MSYRRRRSYRGSPGTNFVRQRYQYFVDMQTKADTMQIINVTAGGLMPQIRLRAFFGAFKYFKLGSVKIRFVPAATLPVDPTGLSYEEGEQTVDPRDQMNPGLVRITNGEDVSELTSLLTGIDAERAYYSTMLDPRWYKFQLQSGFRRTAKPLVWNVGQTAQSITQGIVNATDNGNPGTPLESYTAGVEQIENNLSSTASSSVHSSVFTKPGNASSELPYMLDPYGSALMQVNRQRMGWMPTDMFNNGVFGPNAVPEVDLITIILPKAYKTSYFYRVYIEEEVLFKDAVSVGPIVSTFTGSGESITALNYLNYAAVDRFLIPGANSATGGNNYNNSSSTSVQRINKLNGGSV